MKSRSSTVASEVVGTWLPLLPLSPLVHLAASTPHFFLLLEHAKHVCALRYLHCLFLLVESSEVRFPRSVCCSFFGFQLTCYLLPEDFIAPSIWTVQWSTFPHCLSRFSVLLTIRFYLSEFIVSLCLLSCLLIYHLSHPIIHPRIGAATKQGPCLSSLPPRPAQRMFPGTWYRLKYLLSESVVTLVSGTSIPKLKHFSEISGVV